MFETLKMLGNIAALATFVVKDEVSNYGDDKTHYLADGFTAVDELAESVAESTTTFLKTQKKIENAQFFKTDTGYVVQANDPMFTSIKGLLGTDQAIQMQLVVGKTTITSKLGLGEWTKKTVGSSAKSIVKGLVFAPLLVTDAVGSAKQIKLLRDVHKYVEACIMVAMDEWNKERGVVAANYSVVLQNSGEDIAKVNTRIREITGMGLAEAKKLMDNVPQIIKAGLTANEANMMKLSLENVGAVATVNEV